MEILNTQRLILRTMQKEDFETLYKIVFSDYEVVNKTFGSNMFNLEETKEFLRQNANFDNKEGLSVIVQKDSNKIIGLGGVIRCEYLNTIDYEIGFILEKNSWGKGYAKEIGLAQIEQIKNEFKQNRALALVDPLNEASIKSIKSLGLKKLDEVVNTSRGERLVYSINF